MKNGVVKKLAAIFGIVTATFFFLSKLYAKDFGDALIICHMVPLSEINPLINTSTMSANIIDLIFDPLVEIDEDRNLIPAIAKRWEISPDGRVRTFFIRDDVFFHNGRKLTSKDVVATYKAILSNQKASLSSELSNLVDVDSLDDYTVRFTFKRFDSFFQYFLAFTRIVPQELLKDGIDGPKLIGTGPYKVMTFSPYHIELQSFDGHFSGRPFLNKIIVNVAKSERACISQLISGNVDMVFHDEPSDISTISKIPGIHQLDIGHGIAYVLLLNRKKFPFSDPQIRRAVDLALSHDAIEKKLSENAVYKDVLQQNMTGINPEDFENTYDPLKSLSLLKEKGFVHEKDGYLLEKGGQKFEFEISMVKGYLFFTDVFKQIKSLLEDVGVSVSLGIYDMEEFSRKVFQNRDYQAVLFFIPMRELLPLEYTFWHSTENGGNFLGFSDPQVDRNLDILRYGMNEDEQSKAKQNLIDILKNDPPLIPLFVLKYQALVNDRFRDFNLDSFRFFSGLRNVWVPKEKQLRIKQEGSGL